jgi:CheY-like chemotaxis protein
MNVKQKILIADDSEINRALLMEILGGMSIWKRKTVSVRWSFCASTRTSHWCCWTS